MKVLRTMLGVGTTLLVCDTIEHAGGLWLVPHWIADLVQKARTPVRIIRLDRLPHQKMPPPYPADYLLNGPISRDVLDGLTTFSAGVQYEVVESPAIHLPLPTALH